jgi:hypothetical protein
VIDAGNLLVLVLITVVEINLAKKSSFIVAEVVASEYQQKESLF